MSSSSQRPAPMRAAPTGGLARDELTMRDWFGGKALAGIIASSVGETLPDVSLAARMAYEYADAMIAIRERRREEV